MSLHGQTLMLITDVSIMGSSPIDRLQQTLAWLAPQTAIVQLRDSVGQSPITTAQLLFLAKEMRAVTYDFGCPLYVNDRTDIALAVGADGVHLKESSMGISVVKKKWPELQIGKSTHCATDAVKAAKLGADLVLLGPVYPTASKLSYGPALGLDSLMQAKKSWPRGVSCRLFGVGGVNSETAPLIMKHADGLAMIRGVWTQPLALHFAQVTRACFGK